MQPAREGGKSSAPSATDDLEDEDVGSSLMSGVKAELVNWQEHARPAEAVLTCLIIVLLALALSGTDWICGATGMGKFAHVGIRTMHDGSGSGAKSLVRMCAEAAAVAPPPPPSGGGDGGIHVSVACALAASGSTAGSLATTALATALLLGVALLLEALAARGALNGMRAKLPPSLQPHAEQLGELLPAACWSLLLLFTFLTLLLYALKAPGSLGAGLATLGLSYGLVRLAMLLSLVGLGVHLSLVHHMGEDMMISALDALRGHWSSLLLRQKVTQLLLTAALVCEVLLWMQRVEWGGLLVVYGLWAFLHHDHDSLCVFCSIACFSMCTDALSLASADARSMHGTMGVVAPVLTWALLLCKLGAVGMLVYCKDAFI